MAIISVDERTKKNLELYKTAMNEDIAKSDSIYDSQAATVRELYGGTINDSVSDYTDLERQNSVQKLINEREVAESMANLGLTDSGLSRTQLTAVQLSAANNAAKIARERQQMVNSLTREMTAEIKNIELSKQSAQQGIKDKYTSLAQEAAVSEYNADVEAETARQKALYEAETERQKAYYSAIENEAKLQNEPKYVISHSGFALNRDNVNGTLEASGIDVMYNDDYTTTYFDNNSGKKTTVKKTVNPYTLADNEKLINKYGAFSNGYQPKGSDEYGKITDYNGWFTWRGNNQKIWITNKGKLIVWNGATNEYEEIPADKLKELEGYKSK